MSSATALHDLAAAFGIDTDFHDWQGEHQQVADETLRAVLGAFGVDAADDETCRRELEA